MDRINLDLGKLVNGIGLGFDLIAIIILLLNEIRTRDIENKKRINISEEDDEYYEKLEKEGKGSGVYYSREAMEAEFNHPPEKALILSKWGMLLLILGFVIQICSLFIYI